MRYRDRNAGLSLAGVVLRVVLLAAIWAGCIVFIGAAFRATALLFCIGYGC